MWMANQKANLSLVKREYDPVEGEYIQYFKLQGITVKYILSVDTNVFNKEF